MTGVTAGIFLSASIALSVSLSVSGSYNSHSLLLTSMLRYPFQKKKKKFLKEAIEFYLQKSELMFSDLKKVLSTVKTRKTTNKVSA